METRFFNKSLLSSIIFSSILVWTMICFMGTLLIILEYEILTMGLIATVVTFFFATVAWAIPIAVLALFYPFVARAKKQSSGNLKMAPGGYHEMH